MYFGKIHTHFIRMYHIHLQDQREIRITLKVEAIGSPKKVSGFLLNYIVLQLTSYSSRWETVCKTMCTGSARWGFEYMKDKTSC
jgi:hypothetical protein